MYTRTPILTNVLEHVNMKLWNDRPNEPTNVIKKIAQVCECKVTKFISTIKWAISYFTRPVDLDPVVTCICFYNFRTKENVDDRNDICPKTNDNDQQTD